MKCANCKVSLGPGEALYILNVPLCWCCYGAVIDEVLAGAGGGERETPDAAGLRRAQEEV